MKVAPDFIESNEDLFERYILERTLCDDHSLEVPPQMLSAYLGNIQDLKDLHREGFRLDIMDCSWTPLMLAAGQGHIEAVMFMLKLNVDVNTKTLTGWSARMWAYKGRHSNVVNELSTRINEVDLVEAAMLGDYSKVQNLLGIGMNDVLEVEKSAAFLIAAEVGNLSIVQLLMERRININIGDIQGYTALMRSADNGQYLVLKFLLEHGADPNLKNTFKQDALSLAIRRNSIEMVETLIASGADINSLDDLHWTPLTWAIVYNYTGIVESLINRGALIRIQEAAMLGNATRVHELLLLGTSSIHDNASALRWAAEYGHKSTVDLLLRFGADPNSKDASQQTAIMLAASNKRTEIVRVLLENGANVHVLDNEGRQVLELAVNSGDFESAQYLLEAGADANFVPINSGIPCLIRAIYTENEDTIRLLLQHGADVQRTLFDGWTAKKAAAAINDSTKRRKILALLNEFRGGS